MRLAPTIWFSPSEDAVRRFGITSILVGSGLLLALLLLLVWRDAAALPIFLAVVVAVPAFVLLFRRPFLNLCLLLSLSVVVSGHEEGFQVTEIIFGIYYMAYLGHWFATRLFIYRERLLVRAEDKAILFFLILATLWIPLTFLFGGAPKEMISEWTALLLMGFYFPVKEAFLRYRKGPIVLLAIFLWMGIYAAVAHIGLYQQALTSAEHAWQVVTERVSMNDTLLMVVSLVVAVLFLHAQKRWLKASLGGIFAAVFVGLILTQSRAIWVSFALGCFFILLASDRRQKKTLLWISAGGITIAGVMGLVFLPEYFDLVLFGLFDRFASLSTAFTTDLSLINRFHESAAVLAKIALNPIVGYGMGVSYHFFDITFQATIVRGFIHSGYLSLWYKFGILGIGLMMFFWFRCTWIGFRAFRISPQKTTAAVTGLAAAASLGAMMLSAHTSNPFYLGDTTLTFALLTGLAAGAHELVGLSQANARTVDGSNRRDPLT